MSALQQKLAEAAENVRALEPGEFWIASLICTVVALISFYGIFRFYFRARLIEDIPTSKIRSAPQGYIELEGRGELMKGTPIVGPLTGRQCLWYSYRIEERQESYDSKGHRHSRWRTIESGVSDNLFLLKDDTGICVIDPEKAEVTPSDSDTWYGSSLSDYGTPASRSGFNSLFSSGRYRYSEKRIDVAEHLYAIGRFYTVGGNQELPNTHEEIRALLRAWKRDQAGLVERFDADGDGNIDVQEWEQARKAARRQVLKEQRERQNKPAVNILAKPKSGRRPFILSVIPQDKLVRRYKLFSLGSGSLFFVLGLVAAWMYTVRFLLG